MTSTPAVVLAAGASKRLGTPKILVEWKGETLIQRSIRQLREAGINEIVIVTRRELVVDILTLVKEVEVVINPEPDAGRTGTIQRGIIALMNENGRVPKRLLVVPVDRPGWTSETVAVLLSQDSCCSPEPAGHPVLIYEVEALLAAEKHVPLRSLIKPLRIAAPGVFINVDTPVDLEGLK